MSRHPYQNRNPHQRSWSDRPDMRRRDFFGVPHNDFNDRSIGNRDMFFGVSHQRNFDMPEQHQYRGSNSFQPQHQNRFPKSREQNFKRRHSSNFSGGNNQRYNQGQSSNVSQDNVISNRILHHAEKKQRLEEQQEKEASPEYSISVDEILLFKEEVRNCITKVYLDEICARKARYTYYVGWKGHSQAMEYSQRKPPKVSKSFKCVPCDSYSNSEGVHQAHLNAKLHHQINLIYTQLKKLAVDWVEEKSNWDHKLKPSTLKAEKDGLVISSENTLRDEFFESDSWLHDIDLLNNDTPEKFVLAALEIRMKTIWPQPKSVYHCRVCNYAEYTSKELLERHMKSARHLEFERHYKEAFCVTCQIHNGDEEGMQKHSVSNKHRQIFEILEDTKAHAISFWENIKEKRTQENIPSEDKMSTRNFQRTEEYSNKRMMDFPMKEASIPSEDISEKILPHKHNPSQNIGIVAPMVTSNPVVASVTPIISSQSVTQTSTITKVQEETPPIVFPVHSPTPEVELKGSPTKIENKGTPTKSEPQHKDGTETPSKSKSSEFTDNKNEGDNKTKDIAEEKVKKNTFDDFIVPLTGYMCTICHQTLDDDDEATTHMYSYEHRKNKEQHANRFGTDSFML